MSIKFIGVGQPTSPDKKKEPSLLPHLFGGIRLEKGVNGRVQATLCSYCFRDENGAEVPLSPKEYETIHESLKAHAEKNSMTLILKDETPIPWVPNNQFNGGRGTSGFLGRMGDIARSHGMTVLQSGQQVFQNQMGDGGDGGDGTQAQM